MRGLIKQTLLKLLAVAGLAAAVSSGQAQDIQVVSYTNTAWIYNDTSVATTNPTIAPGVSWRDPAYVPVLGPGINTWKTNGHGLFGNDTSTVYTNFFGTAGNGFRTHWTAPAAASPSTSSPSSTGPSRPTAWCCAAPTCWMTARWCI